MQYLKKLILRIIKYLVSLLLMLFSFTIGLFSKKGQYIHSIICEYFGFAYNKIRLPQVPWAQVTGNQKVELIDLEVKAGNMPVSELAVICGIIRKEQPQRILEIGTMDGRTTVNMALNAPQDCQVYTLDLPKEELAGTKYRISKRYQILVDKEISGELFLNKDEKEFPAKQKITQLLGDSAKFDFSPFHNTFDFVFIDGSHDYQYVLNDSEIALKLLRNRKGIILWHDYRNGLDVVPALETLKKQHRDLQIYHIKDTGFAYLKSNYSGR